MQILIVSTISHPCRITTQTNTSCMPFVSCARQRACIPCGGIFCCFCALKNRKQSSINCNNNNNNNNCVVLMILLRSQRVWLLMVVALRWF